MRIRYVSHARIPSREANSVQVMKMCAAFAAAGHEVTLSCLEGDADADPHGHYGVAPTFALDRLPAGRLRVVRRFAYSWRLAGRIARAEAPDLLYGRDYHSLAVIAARRVGSAPLALEVHQPPGNALERALLRSLLRSGRLRLLVSISRALLQEYERLFAPLRVPSLVAPDGADAPRSVPEPDPRRGGEEGLALGYLGNLYPGKGIELIEELSARLPRCSFHVVGGKEADVARWSRRLVRPNVHFHGYLSHPEAQARMRTFDALLAPYQEAVLIGGDGTDIGRWMSPLKVFEYMASGRPMIASDLPVLREVLEHEVNALLAPSRDVAAWVRAVERLQRDPALAARLAARARADLEGSFTWRRRAERILGALGPS